MSLAGMTKKEKSIYWRGLGAGFLLGQIPWALTLALSTVFIMIWR